MLCALGFALLLLTGAGIAAADTVVSTPLNVPNCRIRVVYDVELASERSGILAEVVPAGSQVRAGEPVAGLRNALERARLAMAEREAANDIEIRFARKAAELAQIRYERMREANRALSGTVTELELREARLAAEKALLQLEQAEHQFQMAALRYREQQETFRTYQITAPFNGFVRLTHKLPGEVVREGEVVLEMVNTERLRVEGFIEARHSRNVQPGTRVQVHLESAAAGTEGRLTFEGQITFVDVKVEPVSQRVRVWAEVMNRQQRLRDGLLATMRIFPGSQAVGEGAGPRTAERGAPRRE